MLKILGLQPLWAWTAQGDQSNETNVNCQQIFGFRAHVANIVISSYSCSMPVLNHGDWPLRST